MSSSVSSLASVKFFVLVWLRKFVDYDMSRTVSDEKYLILIFAFVCLFSSLLVPAVLLF